MEPGAEYTSVMALSSMFMLLLIIIERVFALQS